MSLRINVGHLLSISLPLNTAQGFDVSQQRVVACAVSILDAAGKLEHTTLFVHLHYPEVVTLYLPALQGRQPYFDVSVTI